MRFSSLLLAVLLPAFGLCASDDKEEASLLPCTIKSPTTSSFFDLQPINVIPPDQLSKKKTAHARESSWHALGYDYGANFTLNFCGPVIESLSEVQGVEKSQWPKTGAFYEKGGKTYSIGMNNSEPVFRGRKLVLNYTDGSPCPSSSTKNRRALLPHTTENYSSAALKDGDKNKATDNVRRKSTIISLLCERDPTKRDVVVSFVGASPDECSYFFEARTSAACPSANVQKQTLGPSGVFGVIATIAILVYVIGGVVYQRVVMHQRGWYQLPNYALWSGIAGFVKDMVIIIGSSCMRCIPGRRSSGYTRASSMPNGNYGRSGRRNPSDDENRLIDQLDEEWDD